MSLAMDLNQWCPMSWAEPSTCCLSLLCRTQIFTNISFQRLLKEFSFGIVAAQTSMCNRIQHFEHDDVIKWKHFPRHWPFVRGKHRSPVNSPQKDQWRGALMFSLICALNKRLSKQSWCWWFETPSRSSWRHFNEEIQWNPFRCTLPLKKIIRH